jgi:hypothetical protein
MTQLKINTNNTLSLPERLFFAGKRVNVKLYPGKISSKIKLITSRGMPEVNSTIGKLTIVRMIINKRSIFNIRFHFEIIITKIIT